MKTKYVGKVSILALITLSALMSGGCKPIGTGDAVAAMEQVPDGVNSDSAKPTFDSDPPDYSLLFPPTVTTHSDGQPDGRWISNQSVVTITGQCKSGSDVRLSGYVDYDEMVVCRDKSYSFTIDKSHASDGDYFIYLSQRNHKTAQWSAETLFHWTLDRQAPLAPEIISPQGPDYVSSGDLNIAGICERGAKVHLQGDDEQSLICAGYSFTFTVRNRADGEYHFTLSQTDAAGNVSELSRLRWLRDSRAPVPPTVTSPAANVIFSDISYVTISGNCQTGAVVILEGDVVGDQVAVPNHSLTSVCDSGGYLYVIVHPVDGNYNFHIRQAVADVLSSAVSVRWTRVETAAPETMIDKAPERENDSNFAAFAFVSDDPNATFECMFDAGHFRDCQAAMIYEDLAPGPHELAVRSRNRALNSDSTPAIYSWNQF